MSFFHVDGAQSYGVWVINLMKELPKTYEPHAVEDRWIKEWLERSLFGPSNPPSPPFSKGGRGDLKTFSIVIPPPNVTGSLHMGHALNNTLQDILVRYHRMKGDNTLWVVGTDHAGIATQNVVEKQLKAEGKSRFDLGREKFVERVWKWKEESGGTIINQLKRLGASCDYANERFTMDEGLSKAVRKVFVQLFEEGLIYRGLRLINWCPRCHTALSDLEVEHETQKGKLWHIKYGELIVATTRPETLFGDVAVAVHPDDVRYQKLVGKKVPLPLTDREIPIIADDYVDQTFGSGVVKITPAHDFNDFTVGERHQLSQINIFNESAHLNDQVPVGYRGLDRFKAREKAIEELTQLGLLEKTEDHQNAVGHCYRCRTVVEPYLSYQWFVKTKTLAAPAIEAVKTGKTKFVPEHWEKTYFNWMENIQDWCISRQIWWGHQIPAWYCENPPNPPLPKGGKGGFAKHCEIIVSETPPKSCPQCGSTKLTQDPDVLDTWFSSALWPFSTLGWPGDGGETPPLLKTFYPTSVLVTAFDIIFFWVARMMMMGIHFMKEPPFKTVHIHAIVRDPLGQKMSKSKGNVVDPLILMQKYGTDAFRFTLAAFAAQGRDIKLDEARVEGYRNFCNKIWNATRFAMMMNEKFKFVRLESDFKNVSPMVEINQWILVELNQAIKEVREAIENYEFNKAAQTIYSFFWFNFCDWYLELAKMYFNAEPHQNMQKQEVGQVTYHVLDVSLKLLHPFMPFISEEIWHKLGEREDRSIALEKFPAFVSSNDEYQGSANRIRLLVETISAIRNVRQETGLSANKNISIEIEITLEKYKSYEDILSMIMRVGLVNGISLNEGSILQPSALIRVKDGYIGIRLAENGIDIEKEKTRVNKKKEKISKDIVQLESKLNDAVFMERAELELKKEKMDALAVAYDLLETCEKELRLL